SLPAWAIDAGWRAKFAALKRPHLRPQPERMPGLPGIRHATRRRFPGIGASGSPHRHFVDPLHLKTPHEAPLIERGMGTLGEDRNYCQGLFSRFGSSFSTFSDATFRGRIGVDVSEPSKAIPLGSVVAYLKGR